MTVSSEAGVGCYTVFVDDTKGSELVVVIVLIAAEVLVRSD